MSEGRLQVGDGEDCVDARNRTIEIVNCTRSRTTWEYVELSDDQKSHVDLYYADAANPVGMLVVASVDGPVDYCLSVVTSSTTIMPCVDGSTAQIWIFQYRFNFDE